MPQRKAYMTPLRDPFARRVSPEQSAARRQARDRKPSAPRGALPAALAEVLALESTVAQAARVHGCDRRALQRAAEEAFRAAVMKRDGWTCGNCGRAATDVQHRARRGMGGCSDPAIAFGMSNGIAICRECHDCADRRRDAVMGADGFWLEQAENPAAVPVAFLTRSGRVTLWLLADGGTSDVPPAEGAAA